MLSPIGGRRGLTFTRDNIKSLISKDEDIKKILKDLVRVTMNKVDLKTRKSVTPSEQVIDKQKIKEREAGDIEKKEDSDFLEME